MPLNRDQQTGIMNLLLEGGFRRGQQRAVKMGKDSRRGQTKQEISGLRQLGTIIKRTLKLLRPYTVGYRL